MEDLLERINALSTEKRALLASRNPLSFAQERLWFLHQLDRDSAAYNIPAALRLAGKLDVAALVSSLNEIIKRHENLRTSFATIDGYPIQIVLPSLTLSMPVVELSELPIEAREQEVRRLAQAEAKRPFALAQGPLLRATLIVFDYQDHVTLFTMHHIISDAWSTGVLVRELTSLYSAFVTGSRLELPELPIQYADYAQWQREWFEDQAYQSQIDYWRIQLAESDYELELPTDRARPKIQTFNGARQSLMMSKQLLEKIKAVSRKEGVTLFMTLLAAFQTLLYRYSGQEQISVGTPIANRNRLEVEGLIGFFINTLVLRTSLSGDPTFGELLKRVKQVALGAYSHQDVPFEKLVEELQPERSLSHSPLFQVMFDLQNVPTQALEFPGLSLSFLEATTETEQFDLSLSMLDTGEGLRASLGYNTDLFDRATIARMLNHYETLMNAMASSPDSNISEMPLMSDSERNQIVVEWNETRSERQPNKCLHELFESQAARTPDAVAVVYDQHSLTYSELNRRANQLARYLAEKGVERESRVGIFIERSLDMVVALLGCMKAGAGYVPLDPSYPRKRLAFYLKDSRLDVVLTQRQFAEAIRTEHDVQLVCLDADWEIISEQSDENFDSGVTPENLICVIYTSGSSGKPKGVMLAHRGVCNRLLWEQARNPLTEADAILQTSSLNFDISIWEVFTALLAGGRVVLARSVGYQEGAYLIDVIAREQISIISCVPSMLQVLISHERIRACASLKRALCGGEAMPVELQDEFFSKSRADLHNSYGPTEGSIDATFWACKRDDNHRTIPIGKPIANMRVYILDANSQPVPVGIPGELHISGTGVARGYLDLPDLTADRFIPDPLGCEAGARLYKTGDKARFLPEGDIEFLGRFDEQVKLRGFRIELREIENVLLKHETIREAVVVIREDEPGDRRLAAYMVSANRERINTSEIRSYLREELPEYMVPSYFLQLEALPCTPNGKINRRALPAPGRSRPELDYEFVSAETPVEELIANIWADALKLDRVGMHDNFFDLGGHSLLAVRVHDRLCKELKIEIPLLRLFEYSTVHTLAQFLTNSQQSQFLSAVQTEDWARNRRQALRQQRQRRSGA
jgi:amino acid adenylation domain-containing protein